jgi:ATP-dependent DNA ligase
MLDSLHAVLAGLERGRPRFDRGHLPRTGVHWMQPRLVAQVGFSEWTTGGQLRHPRFQGPRDDKDPPMSSGRCHRTPPGKHATVPFTLDGVLGGIGPGRGRRRTASAGRPNP